MEISKKIEELDEPKIDDMMNKDDMMKNFRELPSMMNPPEEMVKSAIEEYKQKKLSL